MSIAFRCTICGHRLRASEGMAGKKCRCKCGNLVAVPQAEVVSAVHAGLEAPQPASLPAPADLDDLMSAWSPLCSSFDDTGMCKLSKTTSSVRPKVLAGVGVLAIVVIAAGVFFIPGIVQQPSDGDANPSAAPDPSTIVAQVNPPHVAPPAVEEPKKPAPPAPAKEKEDVPAKKDPAAKNPAKEEKPPQPAKKPPLESDTPKKDEPKPVKEAERFEIVAWHVASSFQILEGKDKIDTLSLNAEAEKAGFVLVAVKLSLAPRLLAGTEFSVLQPDVKLLAKEPHGAIGCGVGDKVFFAPTEGSRAYTIDYSQIKAGNVTQSWLFVIPRAELDSGRTQIQFRDLPPLPLTPSTRRMKP